MRYLNLFDRYPEAEYIIEIDLFLFRNEFVCTQKSRDIPLSPAQTNIYRGKKYFEASANKCMMFNSSYFCSSVLFSLSKLVSTSPPKTLNGLTSFF